MYGILRCDAHSAVFDVGVSAFAGRGFDTQSIALESLGQIHDVARQGGREHQCAPLFRRGFEDEFQILAESQVEHFVGFVQHHGFEAGNLEAIAFQMVAKPPRRADDDVATRIKLLPLGSGIHAADAGYDACSHMGVEPRQLAMHLQG